MDNATNYWSVKHKILFKKIKSIDWEACGNNLNKLTFPKKRRTIKHATGHFGNGKMMLT